MRILLSKIKFRHPGESKFLFSIDHWELKTGSKVLIHGPSGTGKTTFLHLVAGLVPPTEGKISIASYQLSSMIDDELSALRRKHYGIVFQKLNLIEHLTVLENILLPLPNLKTGKEIAHSALKELGIDHLAPQRCVDLSLGEQQRVAVARVLALRPDIILADEPTSSLDSKNALSVIKSLFHAADKKTLLVVSHDDRISDLFSTQIDFKQWSSP